MAKALVFTAVDTTDLVTIALPALGAVEVLIETAYSCVSPGTELRCLSGKQAGAAFPFVPGYSLSGRVAAVGAAVTGLAPGDPVFCTGTAKADLTLQWGGHVSHAIQPVSRVYPLTKSADLLAAATAHMAAIAFHGYRLCTPGADDQVVVIGLGLIGQLAARCHRLSGARVLGIDIAEHRAQMLRELGMDAVTDWAAARAALPDGADLLVDATGANPAINRVITLARDVPWNDTAWTGTRVLIQGSYADDLRIPYQDAFMKQLSFWLTRDAHPADLRAVLDLIGSDQLLVRDLISTVVAPTEAPAIYPQLRAGNLMTAAFDWQLIK